MILDGLIGQKLKWVQPHSFRLEYELHAQGSIIATLRYPRFFDPFAIAESGGESWTFKGGKIRQPIVSIRTDRAETNVGVFRKNLWASSGILEISDGRRYLATVSGSRLSRYDISTEAGQILVSYTNVWGVLHGSGETLVHRAAEGLAELPWIVLLGWHLVLV